MTIKTAILVDNLALTRWQKNALNEAKGKIVSELLTKNNMIFLKVEYPTHSKILYHVELLCT